MKKVGKNGRREIHENESPKTRSLIHVGPDSPAAYSVVCSVLVHPLWIINYPLCVLCRACGWRSARNYFFLDRAPALTTSTPDVLNAKGKQRKNTIAINGHISVVKRSETHINQISLLAIDYSRTQRVTIWFFLHFAFNSTSNHAHKTILYFKQKLFK